MLLKIAFATLSFMLAANVQALGINCRGSLCCPRSTDFAQQLADMIANLDPSDTFTSGQQMACLDTGSGGLCDGQVCAFLQNTGSTFGVSQLTSLANDIVGHGCSACGSVPVGFPDSNDVSQGELTFNYVSGQ